MDDWFNGIWFGLIADLWIFMIAQFTSNSELAVGLSWRIEHYELVNVNMVYKSTNITGRPDLV